jgi:hypothetical protein
MRDAELEALAAELARPDLDRVRVKPAAPADIAEATTVEGLPH